MLNIFKKQTGTKVKMVVEYELDYNEKVTKSNVNDIVDIKDLLRDPKNITMIRDLELKAIKN